MKIAFFGNFGVQNLGDDLILKGLMQQWKGHELVVFCGNPRRIREEFGLEAHPFFPGGFRSMLRYLTETDHYQEVESGRRALFGADKIVVGGGGILVDRHLKAVALWWRQLRVIAKSGRPYEFAANSFELKRGWSRALFGNFLRQAEKISVRDRASQQFIASLGLKADLVPDLGLSTLTTLTIQPAKKIALALCQWGLQVPQLEALKNFIQRQKGRGYEVVGLAFQTDGDDDREIFQKLDADIRVVSGLERVLVELRRCELLVGMRFHALLLALHLGIPVIALAYQDKVTNLMQDQGMADRCIPIQNLDEQKLQELFLKAIEARDGSDMLGK